MNSESEPELAKLQQQIQQVSAGLGFGQSPYGLIVVGNNIVFKNPKDRVVARVVPVYMDPADVNGSLTNSRKLEQSGAPVLPPLHDEAVELPIGRLVTFWPLASANPDLNGHKLAQLAAQLHQTPPPGRLRSWTPNQRIKQRLLALEIGQRDGLPKEMAKQLRQSLDQRLEALEAAWQASNSPTGALHGDFYYGNVVELGGRLLLCDLDELCSGPREVDLATIQISCRHYLEPGYWDQFLADYPDDYDRDLLKACFDLQTMGVIIWQAAFWRSRPAARVELQRRLKNLNNPDFRWHKTSKPN